MKIYTVDAFTKQPFSGNPAGVCILDSSIPEGLYTKISREINYSETAFVLPNGTGNNFSLRWFTPSDEVDLCGHATLAAAKILFNFAYVSEYDVIHFQTKSGILTAKRANNKIELNFPPIHIQPSDSDETIEGLIHSKPKFVGKNETWCLIEVENEYLIHKLKPDFTLLKKYSQKIILVTATSLDENYDFVSRCFGPAIGINEDPVTGSAHCLLAPYWAEKLRKNNLLGYQASKRSGEIECEISENRILLRGEAVIMSEIKPTWI